MLEVPTQNADDFSLPLISKFYSMHRTDMYATDENIPVTSLSERLNSDIVRLFIKA